MNAWLADFGDALPDLQRRMMRDGSPMACECRAKAAALLPDEQGMTKETVNMALWLYLVRRQMRMAGYPRPKAEPPWLLWYRANMSPHMAARATIHLFRQEVSQA